MSTRYNFTKKFQDEVHRLLREKEYIGAKEYELGSKKIKTPVDIYLACARVDHRLRVSRARKREHPFWFYLRARSQK